MAASDLTPRFEQVAALGPHGFVKVAYSEWGPREAEQVVVCVHGLTRNKRDFDFLALRLAQGRRRGRMAQADPARGLVDEVDRLVGQVPVGDVAD